MNALVSLINSQADAWLRWTLHSTWQGLVVLALALGMLAVWRRASSVWRYSLLMIVLAKFVLPPVGVSSLCLFGWLGPALSDILPSRPPAPAPASEQASPVPPPQVPSDDYEMRSSYSRSRIDHGMAENVLRDETRPLYSPSAKHAPVPAPVPAPAPRVKLTTAGWALLVQAMGSIGLLTIIFFQGWRLRRSIRRTRRLEDGPLFDLTRELASRLRLRRLPRIYVCPSLSSPQAGGVTRPFVLLPAWTAEAPEQDQRALIAHELAHLRRRDPLAAWLQLFAQAWLWWNPAVWRLNRRIRAERELCCDDLVLGLGLARSEGYSRMLVDVAARFSRSDASLEMAGMADSFQTIRQRVRRALDGSLRRPVRLSLASLTLMALIAAFVLPGAIAERSGKKSAGAKVAPSPKPIPPASHSSGSDLVVAQLSPSPPITAPAASITSAGLEALNRARALGITPVRTPSNPFAQPGNPFGAPFMEPLAPPINAREISEPISYPLAPRLFEKALDEATSEAASRSQSGVGKAAKVCALKGVVTFNGAPVAGAKVMFGCVPFGPLAKSNPSRDTRKQETQTDRAGAYQFSASGNSAGALMIYFDRGAKTYGKQCVLQYGEEKEQIVDFAARSGPALLCGNVTVNTHPLAKAAIRIADHSKTSNLSLWISAQTDEDGRYILDDIESRNYSVVLNELWEESVLVSDATRHDFDHTEKHMLRFSVVFDPAPGSTQTLKITYADLHPGGNNGSHRICARSNGMDRFELNGNNLEFTGPLKGSHPLELHCKTADGKPVCVAYPGPL
ncbi:MAG: M56 family metallopeptidase, partial [Candidatus Sumerlaeota bacterium]|nr:M56 family metallopeptidase [Candidatus Sumerlaeota bacterium]